jgi:hypothetical protein
VLAKSSLLITKPSSWPLILIMWICLSVHYTCMFWLVVQAVIFTCHARALVMLRQIKGGLHIKLSVRGIQGMVRVWERREVWKVASMLAFYCLHWVGIKDDEQHASKRYCFHFFFLISKWHHFIQNLSFQLNEMMSFWCFRFKLG